MTKILFFSRDPGGANTIVPLVKPFQGKGYEVLLYGKDVALEKYRIASLDGINISEELDEIHPESLKNWLYKMRPNMIITGTSADDMTEKYIWYAAAELGIKAFAILDQWLNYGIRFSKFGVSQIHAYEKEREHLYLPEKIMVMDEFAKKELAEEGIAAERIIVTGQPYFENLIQFKECFDGESSKKLRCRLTNPDSILITFVSEPITITYQDSDENRKYIGYTEKTIFEALYRGLEEAIAHSDKKLHLVIKTHPKEDKDSYQELLARSNEKIRITMNHELNPWELIMASDIVCGMSSMLLIESVIFGKPILRIQIGLSRKDPFVLSRQGIVRSILKQDELVKRLREGILKNDFKKCAFEVKGNPVENIIRYVEGFVCQS